MNQNEKSSFQVVILLLFLTTFGFGISESSKKSEAIRDLEINIELLNQIIATKEGEEKSTYLATLDGVELQLESIKDNPTLTLFWILSIFELIVLILLSSLEISPIKSET